MQRKKKHVFFVVSLSLVFVFAFASLTLAQKIELVLASPWDTEIDYMMTRVEVYQQLHPDVNVDVRTVCMGTSEHHDKLLINLVAGTGAPDMAAVEISYFSLFYEGLEEWFVDVTDWLKADDTFDQIYPARRTPYMKNGRLYGVGDEELPLGVLYYRKDIFDELGVAMPVGTWEDMIQVGLKAREQGYYLFMEDPGTADRFVLLLNQLGGNLFNAEGEFTGDSEKAGRALQLIKRMLEEGIAFKTDDFWGAGGTTAYAESKVIAERMPTWYLGWGLARAENLAGKWRVAPLPAFEEGGRRTSVQGGATHVVTKQCEHPEIAFEILKECWASYDAQIAKFEQLGYYTVRADAALDPVFLEHEEPFLGGQAWGSLLAELALEAPTMYNAPGFREACDFLAAEVVFPVLEGEKTIGQALREFGEAMRK